MLQGPEIKLACLDDFQSGHHYLCWVHSKGLPQPAQLIPTGLGNWESPALLICFKGLKAPFAYIADS